MARKKETILATNPLRPPASLLCKLGSIVIHSEEARSSGGHYFDEIVLDGLLQDVEVGAWLTAMREMAMLPVKRDG